jgi:hypothetical protein
MAGQGHFIISYAAESSGEKSLMMMSTVITFLERLGNMLIETSTPYYSWALIPNHFNLVDIFFKPLARVNLGKSISRKKERYARNIVTVILKRLPKSILR